jgi:hypothetical protein
MQSSCGECPEVAMIRTAKVAFQAVERVLPAGCPGFQVDAQFLVEAFDNIGRVDLRVGSHNCGLVVGRAVCCRTRRGRRRTCPFRMRAVSGSGYRCRDCGQHKDAQNPRNPSERCHRTPARIHRVAVACRGGSRADYDRLVELSAVRARGVERRFWFSSPPGKSANRPRGTCCLFAISLLLKPHRLRATALTVGGAAAAAVVAAPSLAASPGCRETVRRR